MFFCIIMNRPNVVLLNFVLNAGLSSLVASPLPTFQCYTQKGGRPGRSGYVIGHYLGRGCVNSAYSPTHVARL